MQRIGVILALAAVFAAAGIHRSFADDAQPDPAFDRSEWVEGVVIRAQSPTGSTGLSTSTRLPPPQLRVAQGMAVVGEPYAPIEPCPPAVVATPMFDPYGASVQPTTSQWKTCQIGLFGEFLYLQPRNADVPYAVPQNGLLLPGTAPIGPVAVSDPGFSTGFRVGAWFGLGPDSRLSASYSWYSSTHDTSVETTGLNVLNPLVMFPGTFNAGFTAQSATASYDIKYQLIDIDYQVIADCCDNYWFGYVLGTHAANLEQNFSAAYPFAPPDGTTTVDTTIDFKGIGPRAGVQGERCLFPHSGLRAYGKGSATFLVGQFQSTYIQTNQFNGQEVNTSLDQDRIVPVVDLELGLAWMSQNQCFRISAGYLVSAWFNTITTPAWISSVQRVDYAPGDNTLTFDGLVARAELRF